MANTPVFQHIIFTDNIPVFLHSALKGNTAVFVVCRKREERMRKVAEMREMRQRKEHDLKMNLAQKLKERLNSTDKMKEDKFKEEREKQKQRYVVWWYLLRCVSFSIGKFLLVVLCTDAYNKTLY